MARIQVLALPTETVGDVSATPFALVIDQVSADDFEYFAGAAESLRQLGAKAVLFYDCDLDVVGADQALDEQARKAIEAALAYGAYPERMVANAGGAGD